MTLRGNAVRKMARVGAAYSAVVLAFVSNSTQEPLLFIPAIICGVLAVVVSPSERKRRIV